MNKAEAEKTLRIISKAWGRRQKGYVFFPWIDREEQKQTGSRRAGYHEGPDQKAPGFKWPEDRDRIVQHMLDHQHHDLYWCPSLFEYNARREDTAADEHALWADLDEVDPKEINDYPPTIAWESSSGRYQALWIASAGDFQGASWPGNENQRLTYHLGADRSGWDTTQLLRIPGWVNHKPEYESDGGYPTGKLLWADGQSYLPGDFQDLPEVSGHEGTEVNDALETEIENIDRHKVISRVRLKLTRRIRELLSAREVAGDRSDALWEMERGLADAGCSVAEIVAVVRGTVWNKYINRHDEMRRLIIEASKAIAAKPESNEEDEEEEIERDLPIRLGSLLKNTKPPKFLIEGILTEGACGFIAGEPKCYKSWIGLDLVMSIATGAPFLGRFRVVKPGPVLYIQEEDPPPTLKSRSAKIWSSKSTDKLVIGDDGVEWLPPEKDPEFDPDIGAYVQRGVVVSEEPWQLWLDDILAAGMNGEPYRVLLIDTMMMVAGDVEENRSQSMTTQIFKPLKVLARKHNVALIAIHHMGKGDKARAGQKMLGSTANHAWSEDSLYISRAGAYDVRMELESKTIPGNTWRITNLNNRKWEPEVMPWAQEKVEEEMINESRARKPRSRKPRSESSANKVLKSVQSGLKSTTAIAEDTDLSRSQVWRWLQKLQDDGKVTSSTVDNAQQWSAV